MNEVIEIAGVAMLRLAPDGPVLATGRDASDIVGEAFSSGASWIVIATQRLSPDFLKLSTGLAGEALQKFVNYRFRVAIVGDIATEIAASNALRDFVRESNRGRTVWFVDDEAALGTKLQEAG